MRLFPDLYAISSQQNEAIASMGWYEGWVWNWIFAWTRELTNDELRRADELQSLVTTHNPAQNKKDTLLWNDKRCYTVKAFQQYQSTGVMFDNLVCKVWMNVAPPKVEFFMWLAILEKLNTKELLWKKGLLNEDQIRCTFYSDQAENLNHVLMACSVSWNIWCTIAKDLNQALSMPCLLYTSPSPRD